MSRTPRSDKDRELSFWGAVDIGKQGECWLWTGATNKVTGYGQKWWVSKNQNAHAVAYMLYNHLDSLPPTYQGSPTNIMHTCDVRLCCNPRHLRLGSTKLNQRDKANKKRHHMQTRATCKHGHPWTEENTYYPNFPCHRAKDGTPWNIRYCRECMRLRAEKRRKRGKK